MSAKKNVVILGAGFGGLRAAKLIAKKLRRLGLLEKYEVVLIDRHEHQTYTPLLYEVATTSKETANACKLLSVATYPVQVLIGRLPITFLKKELTALDLVEGDLHFTDGEKVVFDHLLIALGAETNYFGIPGLKQFSFPLKTFEDAIRLRDKVWMLSKEGQEHIRIIVGGAGPTGVELAGELKVWCGELERESGHCNLQIMLVQGSSTILPGFAPQIVNIATARLQALGVETLTGERIASVTKDVLTLASGRSLPYDVCIWTGGVKTPAFLTSAPLSTEPKGRPVAQSAMECLPQTPSLKLRSKIYGIGDSVCFFHPITQQPIPGVARAALSQATVAAHNIIEDIKTAEGSSEPVARRTYIPREYPYVIPIGGKYAIAKAGPIYLKGLLGWMLKGLVELNYLFSIMRPLRALGVWLKGLKIFIQNDRLG
jgi:NADH dehydrogenase